MADEETAPTPDPESNNMWDSLQVGIAGEGDNVAPEAVPLTTKEKALRLIAGDKKKSEQDKSKSTRKPPTRRTEPASKPGEFVEELEQFYTFIGMGLTMLDLRSGHVVTEENKEGNQIARTPCGEVVATQAHQCAEAWDELAQRNPAVRRMLRQLLTTSAASAVVYAHLPIFLTVMQGHAPGILPPMIVPPDDE